MTSQQPPEPLLMDCARAQDLIFDSLESGASGAERLADDAQAALDKHLADCDECLVYRHTLQNLNVSLSELDDVPVPTGLEDRIMEAVAQSTAAKNGSSRLAIFGNRAKRYAPLAAAVLVVAIAIPLVMQLSGPRPHAGGNPEVAQGIHTQPAPGAPAATQMPSQTQSSTELASVPNLTQPVETSVESEHVATPASQPVQTHPAAKAFVPVSSNQQISGQKLAYNPDSPDSFSGPPNTNGGMTSGPNQAGPVNNGGYNVDPSSLASAIPQSAGQHFSDTYASDDDSDVYYDPVSNLVGF